jgi:type II secretory pathway pseudopilin PulG
MERQSGTAFFNTDNMILLAIIGVVAAMLIPLINNYNIAKKVDNIILSTMHIQTKVSNYALEHNKWPLNLKSMTIKPSIKLPLDSHYEVKSGVIYVYLDYKPQLQGELIFTPSRVEKSITFCVT